MIKHTSKNEEGKRIYLEKHPDVRPFEVAIRKEVISYKPPRKPVRTLEQVLKAKKIASTIGAKPKEVKQETETPADEVPTPERVDGNVVVTEPAVMKLPVTILPDKEA